MKKAVLALSAILTIGGILPGCGAYNSAYNNPNAPRNVTYRNNPNTTYPVNPNYNTTEQTYRTDRNGYRNDRLLAKKIADKANAVSGVSNAYVVVNNGNVLVGIVPDKTVTNTGALTNKVKAAVRPLTGNRTIYVTTDNRYIQRIRRAATNFNTGKGMREVSADITGIIDDLARALKRPFQNNSK